MSSRYFKDSRRKTTILSKASIHELKGESKWSTFINIHAIKYYWYFMNDKKEQKNIHCALLMMSQKESPRNHPCMGASWVISRKVDIMVCISAQFSFEKNDGCFLLCTSQACSCSSSIEGSTQEACRKHAGSTHHYLLRQNWELTPERQLF